MDTAQNRLAICNISHDKRHMMLAIEFIHITINSKLTISCRHLCLSHTLHQHLMLLTVPDQICDPAAF